MGRWKYRKCFFTILKNLNYDAKNVGQNVGQKLKPDDRRKHIIEIIEGNSKITALDLSKILYVSERTIERFEEIDWWKSNWIYR